MYSAPDIKTKRKPKNYLTQIFRSSHAIFCLYHHSWIYKMIEFLRNTKEIITYNFTRNCHIYMYLLVKSARRCFARAPLYVIMYICCRCGSFWKQKTTNDFNWSKIRDAVQRNFHSTAFKYERIESGRARAWRVEASWCERRFYIVVLCGTRRVKNNRLVITCEAIYADKMWPVSFKSG